MRLKKYLLLSALFFTIGAIGSAHADTLPYATRTNSYNGFTTGVIGDIRTVGMGGAVVGLGDTFLAASDNPSGLGMTLNIADTNITGNSIHDGHVQDYDYTLPTQTSVGAAVALYPWAFSIGEVPVGAAGQVYQLQNGAVANLQVETHQFRLAAARTLFDNRLSLGLSLNVGVGEEEISNPQLDDDQHAAALGATIGAMYQLDGRLLLGASYTTPMHFAISGDSAVLPGFFQPIDVPSHFDLGMGWIPNRYIRGDFQLTFLGRTRGAALLNDQTVGVGDNYTVQPHFGFAYQFLDYAIVQSTLFAGTYFETSQIQGASDRLHGTAGLEVKPWFFTAGIGVDRSADYKNFLVSVGIDLGRVLEDLNLVPTPHTPPRNGFLPRPFIQSDDGLTRPLVKNWSPKGPEMNPVKIVKALPHRVKVEAKVLKRKFKKLTKKKKPKKKHHRNAETQKPELEP
jgi:hypothetical protein